jgi:hypothetical protein
MVEILREKADNSTWQRPGNTDVEKDRIKETT